MKKFIALLLAFLVLMLASCNVSDGTINEKTEKENYEMPRDLTVDFIAESMEGMKADEKFISSMLDFSAELFKGTLDENEKSSLISPLSVLIALGMTANGACGETKAQFEKVFGMSTDELNAYLYSHMNSLPSGEQARLETANSIWLRDGGFKVNNDFLQINKNFYGAQIYKENFAYGGTADKINSWVSENTDKMIEKIIDEISPDAVMYLINALVFDALWETPYEDYSCAEGAFNSYGGNENKAVFMTGTEHRYIKTEDAVGFKKSYKSGYSFMALLPDGDVFEYIKSLDGEKLSKALSSIESVETITKMPQFSYDYGITMNDALISMGLTSAFDPRKADFSGITDGENGISIGCVLHKTHIELTAAGTRAAAVTSVMLAGSCAPTEMVYVTLDRPFVYIITDDNTNLPVFMGVITEIN